MKNVDRRRVVEQGYDELDETYRHWVRGAPGRYRARFLGAILDRVPRGAEVLEIGCGPGTDAGVLAARYRYTGIDLSKVQLTHARRTVRDGTFLHADVLDVAFPPAGFDAIVTFYTFNHIPQDAMDALFRRLFVWLRPGGLLCASFGTSDNPGSVEPMWLGKADMYFSSLPVRLNDDLLGTVGFAVEFAETITEVEEGEGPATFHWVIARNPSHEQGQRG